MADSYVLPYESSESCRDTSPASIAGYSVAGAINAVAILLAVSLGPLIGDRYGPPAAILVAIPCTFMQFLFGGLLTLLCASRHGHHWIGVPTWERALVVLAGIATIALPTVTLLAIVMPWPQG